MGRKNKDVINRRFGSLLIVDDAPWRIFPGGSRTRMVLCLCDCGREVELPLNYVKRYSNGPCRCLKRDKGLEKSRLRAEALKGDLVREKLIKRKSYGRRLQEAREKHPKSYAGY